MNRPLEPHQQDEFDTFGQHVANHLRSLPLSNAIFCQNFINNYLSEERLKVIRSQEAALSRTLAEEQSRTNMFVATASNSSDDPVEDYSVNFASEENMVDYIKMEGSDIHLQ